MAKRLHTYRVVVFKNGEGRQETLRTTKLDEALTEAAQCNGYVQEAWQTGRGIVYKDLQRGL